MVDAESTVDELNIEPLESRHDRTSFASGRAEIDDFLKEYSWHNQRRGSVRTYVAVSPGAANVAGCFSLVATAVDRASVPAVRAPWDPIPAILIARFGLDRSLHGRGMGAWLLAKALQSCAQATEKVGASLVIVSAIDLAAAGFYRRFGFTPFADNPNHLYIPLKSIRTP